MQHDATPTFDVRKQIFVIDASSEMGVIIVKLCRFALNLLFISFANKILYCCLAMKLVSERGPDLDVTLI